MTVAGSGIIDFIGDRKKKETCKKKAERACAHVCA